MALTTTDPNQLVTLATCFDNCIPIGMQEAVQTFLLAVIAGMDTSPAGVQALVNAAACFYECIPAGEQLAVQNYILAQLASS